MAADASTLGSLFGRSVSTADLNRLKAALGNASDAEVADWIKRQARAAVLRFEDAQRVQEAEATAGRGWLD